jgi:hypothetical protein
MKNYIPILSILVFLFSCQSQKNIAGNYTYKTECAGDADNGHFLLKAWGKGLNKKEAIENARKNALKDVLFLGVFTGDATCARNAMLTEVNAMEKNKSFFEKFFARNGDYKDFIKERKNGVNPKYDKKKSRFGVVYGTILIFKQTELDNYLTKKGVKKSSND